MQLTGSQVIIECLKEQGVDTVFGYPGGAILNVYDELYKHPEIKHVLTSHEQGASHAADGYARSTGKVGVCLATSGPGATNLVTGISTAYMDSIPIVAITCNVGVSLLGKDTDFRSTDGLYHQEYDYPPETILSHSFYMRKPEEFYRFYRNKMLFPNAKPNRAHLALAKLEQEGKLKAVITQNIDGLHQAAGSKEVLELHGSVLRNHCTRCGRFYGLDDILKMKGVPKCGCGGVIKPDVVLYEEGLDNEVIERSIAHIRKADMLIIGGTSLVVYPAAGLIDYYHGNKLVLINKSATSRDGQADLVISDSIGKVLGDAVGV